MTAERWRQIQTIFAQAVECPTGQRQQLLDRVCEGDPALKQELASLLASDLPDEPLVEVPEVFSKSPEAGGDPGADMTGRRIGPYRIIRLIGHGGMGAVYLGTRDDDQYKKQVAIKLLKRGMDTDFTLSRFRQERQILANLEHPFIARLIDGGATEDGLPYFVMEYVDGVPITTYCVENNLPIADRLRLFQLVCEAVQYAHRNLVVHRDIKPSNILTTKEGIPKLLDFGIAKVLGPSLLPGVTYTQREFRMLTPDYASPEQVKGQQISTATDTYSLGAVLYELLTGQRAHRFSSNSITDIERTICDLEVQRPSLIVDKPLRRQLSGDLDNIVLMAMRKEPERRYASAAEFSDDVRRHLEGLPILALEDRWSYRAGKFVRRNRLAVGAAALVAASLIGGMVATTIQARRAEHRFMLARQLAQSVVAEVVNEGSLGRLPGATAARAIITQKVIRYLDGLAQDPGRDPAFQLEIANTYRAVAELEGSPFQQNLGRTDLAMAHYKDAIEIYRRLVSSLPDRNDIKRRALGALVEVQIQSGDIELRAGQVASAKSRLQTAVSLASEAATRDSQALALGTRVWLHSRLGSHEMREGAPLRALPHYREALELCLQWVPIEPGVHSRNTLQVAYMRVASAQLKSGDLEGARENYTVALRRAEEAIRQPDATVAEKTSLAANHKNLGDLLGNPYDFNFGDRSRAESHYRAALAIRESQAAADPQDVRAREDLANIHYAIGSFLVEERPADALHHFQSAARMADQLCSLVPSNTRFRQSLASNQMGIGMSLLRLGRTRDGLERLSPALEAAKSLAPVVEDAIGGSAWVGQIHREMGAGLLTAGNEVQALEHLKQAVAIGEDIVQRAPGNLYMHRSRADAYESLGRYYRALAQTRREHKAEAQAWLQKSRDMWQDWARRNTATPYAGFRERQVATLITSIGK